MLGARQVGKTWLLKEFGQKEFHQSIYIPCERNETIRKIFQYDFNPHRIIKDLELYSQQKINPDNTLLFLDEIQEIPEILPALKYFQEEANNYSIVTAGSNLGTSIKPGNSFPVGKVESMVLRPLNFLEFLEAIGEKMLAHEIESLNWQTINIFHDKLLDLVKIYMLVGGLPEVVQTFISSKQDFLETRKVKNNLALQYKMDFAKHAGPHTATLMSHLWDSIPSQLAKENKKFIWKQIRPSARSAQYEDAVQWLKNSGLIHQVYKVEKPNLPLNACRDIKSFKIYIVDIGILGALSNIDPKIVLQSVDNFIQHKGNMAEQFVLQEMTAQYHEAHDFNYWFNKQGTAEVDFLINKKENVIPIEVKSSYNTQAKSLKVYLEKFSPQRAIKISANTFKERKTTIELPLYAVSALDQVINSKIT